MQLKFVDKPTYRRRLRRVIILIIVTIFPLALIISTALIRLFPNPDGSHMMLNAAGAFIALGIIIFILHKNRGHPYMEEVVYVWDLKQELNAIYRKSRKLKLAIEEGNRDAMIAMNFSYAGSKLLYELDDNTLTMSSLNQTADELTETIAKHGYQISVDDYHRGLLAQF